MEERDNWWIDLELTAFRGAGLGTIDAGSGPVRCVIIPVDDNWLHVTDRGRAYASVAMYERTDRETGQPTTDKAGNTHSLRLNAPKEAREAMTDEARKAIPYVGGAKPMAGGGSKVRDYGTASFSPQDAEDKDEDLPF